MTERRLVHEIRGGNVETEVVLITPKMAKKWLEGHENIRTINWRSVDAMAHDIMNDAWRLTHQGICFNEKGELVDGQHRLHAIIQADRSVRMLVCHVRGITVRDPIDEGRRRSLAVLTGHRTRIIAALGVLRSFEVGALVHRPLTLAESNEYYSHHEEAFQGFSKVPHSGRLVGGIVGACVWAWPCDPEAVQKFVGQVGAGEMIQRGDPAYALRNWKNHNNRGHPEEVAYAACNALRAFLAGQRLVSVYTGESGYRALTSQRRVKRIPHTPVTEVVEGIALKRGRGEEGGDD